MTELWQLYGEDGKLLAGKGATKAQTRTGLLHAAAHVWIWRRTPQGLAVLVQKRALDKPTWPGLWDISAAGHIDLGETPLEAAVRETQEEIGLAIDAGDLQFIGKHRMNQPAGDGIIENEFRYIYLLELKQLVDFRLSDGEVHEVKWVTIPELKRLVSTESVPQGDAYFKLLFQALEAILDVAV